MKLGSHNSWSYLTPKKWWKRPFAFLARCQDDDIQAQYLLHGVRCFDLHLKFKGIDPIVVHNKMEYKITEQELLEQIKWLDNKGDVAIRVLLDVRTKKAYTPEQVEQFINYCALLEKYLINIKFWCGRNLYNYNVNYEFAYKPTCEEVYSSVCTPMFIDDWYPRHFAKYHNHDIITAGTSKDYLLIDFVNYK